MSDTIIDNPYLLVFLEPRLTLSYFLRHTLGSVALAVDYAILVHWMTSQLPVNDQDLYEVYAAYASVLEVGNFNTLMEFLPNATSSTLNEAKIIYFLRHVCSSTTLESDWKISSLTEKEQSRILLCDSLIRLDSRNTEEYQREALQLVRNAEIRKLVRTVDASRIFVDTQRIIDLRRNVVEEPYHRFESLRELTIELRQESNVSIDDLTKPCSTQGNKRTTDARDSAFFVFNSLFEVFAKDFLFHDEYGLDHFLSGRIRHGVIDNELRSVFEVGNLVTKKSGDSYLPNDLWASNLAVKSSSKLATVQEILGKLSNDIDQAIMRVKGTWVQIAFTTGVVDISDLSELVKQFAFSDQGFDYRFNVGELFDFYKKCPEVENVDDFAEYIFGIMWARTEKCLAELRNRIQKDLCSELVGIVTATEQELDLLDLDRNAHLKAALAESRSAIIRKTTSIAQWFRLADKFRLDDYTLESMIATCLTIMRNRNSYYFRHIKVTCNDNRLYPGKTFLLFVDAILLLLGNIIKHARDQIDTAAITVNRQATDNDVTVISVNNKLPPGINTEELLLLIKHGSDRSGLRKEGGTGYVKLLKILKDFDCMSPSVDYVMVNDVLSAQITFSPKGITV